MYVSERKERRETGSQEKQENQAYFAARYYDCNTVISRV